jgi:hypothetical protein
MNPETQMWMELLQLACLVVLIVFLLLRKG